MTDLQVRPPDRMEPPAALQERLRRAWPDHADIGPVRSLARAELAVLAAIILGLVFHLVVLSQVEHRVAQIHAFSRLRNDLARGTAPVGGVDSNSRPLAIGAEEALLEIPKLHLREVVVEGTTSRALEIGPGHLRNTVGLGQAGTSVVYGRSGAYGAPFRRIGSLAKGTEVRVTTAIGAGTYKVIDVRRSGDPVPPPPASGTGRLTLVTATGPPFVPTGLLRVDADLDNAAPPTAPVVTTVMASERPLRGDTEGMWILVLLLEGLIAVEIGALWCWRRWGRAQAWIVFLPVGLLFGYHVAEHVARLLPNLL